MLGVVTYAECHILALYAECRLLSVVMLNVIMLSVVMLNGVLPLIVPRFTDFNNLQMRWKMRQIIFSKLGWGGG